MRILVIEDNPKMAGFIRQGLTEQGAMVEVATTGREGERLAISRKHDIIVLDVMLPDIDGIQVCHNIRRAGLSIPILMLTAMSTTADKVSGLEAGADDYLVKPFEFAELLARLRALLRRGQTPETSILQYDDVQMDLVKRQVTRAGHKIRLTPKEFSLLEYLLRNPEKALSRNIISENVWDIEFDDESNVIDAYVSMLRSKIDRGFARPLIHTVVGTGYLFSSESPVE